MLEKLESRKFILFVLIFIVLSVFVMTGKMGVDQFIGWISANYGIFVLGNTLENINKK
jgi:pheromone shutdown protein TraB